MVSEDMLDMVRPTEGNLHAFYAIDSVKIIKKYIKI